MRDDIPDLFVIAVLILPHVLWCLVILRLNLEESSAEVDALLEATLKPVVGHVMDGPGGYGLGLEDFSEFHHGLRAIDAYCDAI